MSKRTTTLVGIAALLVLLAAGIFLFVRYQLTKSFPQTTGTLRLPGLLAPVTVQRDEFGVPTFRAANEHDELMTFGFVHAQDRLWQMDIFRRAGEGRLSEVFGAATVPFDRMFRTVGLGRIAASMYQKLPDSTRLRLQWYADGVNAYLAEFHGKYPVEFDILRYTPEPWKPEHSVLAGRMLAWSLSLSWWTDVTFGGIAARVGVDKAMELTPEYPGSVPPTVPASVWRSYAAMTGGYLKTAQAFAKNFPPASFLGGSNAWAVAPAHSATGAVLLANDTHLHLSLPALWYEVQAMAPGLNVHGMTVPGMPGVVCGRNDQIAWGVTNLMADDADFYIERVDSTDTTLVQYNGGWEKMSVTTEEIIVRGDTSVPLTIRATRHGPIITDIRTSLQHATPPFVASMRWVGAEVDDQCEAFRRIDRARTWKEFVAGVSHFAVPGQNFVYGDVHGNIGYYCGARIPIRNGRTGLFPLPGWDPAAEWRGFVPSAQLPHLYNPPEGFVASANNKIVDDAYPYRITDIWEPSSRIERLRQVLGKQGEKFSIMDFEQLQNDPSSMYARALEPYVLLAMGDTANAHPDVKRAYEYLSNWQFRYTEDDIATSIFQEFVRRLINNIYRDEMGDDLFHDFVILHTIPLRITATLLERGSSSWFDDVRTDTVESRDDILRRSFREALDTLREQRGPDPAQWRWGDVHTVTLGHPFGQVHPLDRVFSRGPYAIGGGSTTLTSGEFSWNNPYAVIVGPSFRQIFDLGNPREARVVLAGGQSGQVFHDHYDDQIALWRHGGYRIVRLDPTQGEWQTLRLEPEK